MKIEKRIAKALALAMILGMTGCGEPEDTLKETQESALIEAEVHQEPEEAEQEEAEQETSARMETEEKTEDVQGKEYLGGTVQELQTDGMILAQTTLMDDNNSVTLLEVEDAKKISVKFAEDMRVEHWTIQGGGAKIDMQEAAVSDLEPGMGVELEGYYDGESFMATKIIIEE